MSERLSAAEVRQLEFGESQILEFKASLNSRARQEAMEALCGMINTDAAHGTVIFGVSNDGVIKGITGNLDSNHKSLNQHMRDKFDPAPPRAIEIVEHEGKTLLRVKAQRRSGVPLHEYDGRAWIKEGTEKRYLTFEEQMHYRRNRDRAHHNGPWRCSNCGFSPGVLSIRNASDQGMWNSYECGVCGEGEFWPA